MQTLDQEDLCMHDGCDKRATTFEPKEEHWHDYVWCDEHAIGKGGPTRHTLPLKIYALSDCQNWATNVNGDCGGVVQCYDDVGVVCITCLRRGRET